MDPNRLTQKSQEALQEAQSAALRFGHTEVDGEHLLLSLLDQPEGLEGCLLGHGEVLFEERKRTNGSITDDRPEVVEELRLDGRRVAYLQD